MTKKLNANEIGKKGGWGRVLLLVAVLQTHTLTYARREESDNPKPVRASVCILPHNVLKTVMM